MGENGQSRIFVSAAIICLLGGCASGAKPTLEIRNVNHPQIMLAGESSIDRGKLLLRRGQNADAISAFRAALRDDASRAEAHNGLAIAYDSIGRKDLARRYFELAVAERPDEARYRGNLARFFESNGQAELAAGLWEAPVTLASIEPPVVPAEPLAAEAEDVTTVAAQLEPAAANPIAEIFDRLSSDATFQDIVVNEQRATELAVVAASDEEAVQAIGAAVRPAVTPATDAAVINIPSMPLPDRGRQDGRLALVADLPRNDRKLTEGKAPYIERISLGEVKLVTLPFSSTQDGIINFKRLGETLDQWAIEGARQAENPRAGGLEDRTAIKNAVARAAIDDAIASAASLAAVVQQIEKDFVYIAYDSDGKAIAETAA